MYKPVSRHFEQSESFSPVVAFPVASDKALYCPRFFFFFFFARALSLLRRAQDSNTTTSRRETASRLRAQPTFFQ